MRKKHNPHDLILLIGKPKQWREGASIVLIEIYDKLDRQAWREKAIIGLMLMLITSFAASLITNLLSKV